MNCNGKCFLAKQIKEQEKRDATNAIMELSKIEVVSATSYFLILPTYRYTQLNVLDGVYINMFVNTPLLPSIFKPPIC